MNLELFMMYIVRSERKRKRIRRIVYFLALAFCTLGVVLMVIGFFKNDVNSPSTFISFVSIGIAYFAIGTSYFLTWISFDIAEDTDIISMNAIKATMITSEGTQKKIDENNKLVQELLNKLRIEDK